MPCSPKGPGLHFEMEPPSLSGDSRVIRQSLPKFDEAEMHGVKLWRADGKAQLRLSTSG
jgi:hypothetical protein